MKFYILLGWVIFLSVECNSITPAKVKTEVEQRLNPCMTAEMDVELPVDINQEPFDNTTPSVYDLTTPESNEWI